MPYALLCRKTLVTAVLCLIFVGEQAWARPQAAPDPDRLRAHVEFLASDALGGRDSGEPGLEVAAEYIAQRFEEYGLQPAGDHGTYFQYFTIRRGAAFAGVPGLTVRLHGGRSFDLTGPSDVEAFAFGESSEPVDAPLVFAGYGITSDGKDGPRYDDYAGVDVRGKVVVIFRFVPRFGEENGPFGGRRSPHAPFVAKLENAKRHGAAGVIFVTPPNSEDESPYGVAHRVALARPYMPAVIARRAAIERLFRFLGRSLTGLAAAIDRDLKPASFEFEGVRIRFATEPRILRLRNVAARLEGKDPVLARECVVVGAHYDHIGRYGNQVAPRNLGRIHNGADDNASGVAGLLETARLLSLAPARPRRTIHFVAFSGEELGLFGSKHWVDAPRWYVTRGLARAEIVAEEAGTAEGGGNGAPPERRAVIWEAGTVLLGTGRSEGETLEVESASGIRARIDRDLVELAAGPPPVGDVVTMINLDMIGRADRNGATSVIGLETASDFSGLLDTLAPRFGLQIKPSRGMLFGGSDHMHFVRRRVPVLFFFTGMHRDYNTPNDDADRINYEGEARIVGLVAEVASRLADRDRRPVFRPEALSQTRHGQARPILGIRADTAYEGKGVRIAEVLPGTPAERAGLSEGDVILRFGGQEIRNLSELQSAIAEHGRGKVEVRIRRGSEERRIEVDFGTPRGFRVRFGSLPDYTFEGPGVRFEDIQPDSPAARAGVKPGDILLKWGEEDVDGVEEWTALLSKHKPGDKVRIRVKRGDKVLELTVELEGR